MVLNIMLFQEITNAFLQKNRKKFPNRLFTQNFLCISLFFPLIFCVLMIQYRIHTGAMSFDEKNSCTSYLHSIPAGNCRKRRRFHSRSAGLRGNDLQNCETGLAEGSALDGIFPPDSRRTGRRTPVRSRIRQKRRENSRGETSSRTGAFRGTDRRNSAGNKTGGTGTVPGPRLRSNDSLTQQNRYSNEFFQRYFLHQHSAHDLRRPRSDMRVFDEALFQNQHAGPRRLPCNRNARRSQRLCRSAFRRPGSGKCHRHNRHGVYPLLRRIRHEMVLH